MSLRPYIEFTLNSYGITIFSDYLNTPRFIPFDQKGRCSTCKNDNVEIDYAIHDGGVVLFCSRIKKEVFIQFDKYPLIPREGAIVRIKTRSRAFNIPMYGMKKFAGQQVDELIWQTLVEQQPAAQQPYLLPPPPPPPPPPSIPEKEEEEEAQKIAPEDIPLPPEREKEASLPPPP